jgi:hypothetical protein
MEKQKELIAEEEKAKKHREKRLKKKLAFPFNPHPFTLYSLLIFSSSSSSSFFCFFCFLFGLQSAASEEILSAKS